jgi:hypothetical protein
MEFKSKSLRLQLMDSKSGSRTTEAPVAPWIIWSPGLSFPFPEIKWGRKKSSETESEDR